MKPVLWAVLALVLGALLASALLQPASVAEDEEAARVRAARAGFAGDASERPTWRVGDAWRVQFDDGEPVCWLVVVEETAEGYQQGVWCPTEEAEGIASQIAGYDVRYLGRISRDLGGFGADDEEVRFFDWPLEDGKQWMTAWYGADATVTATLDDGRYLLSLCLVEGGCIATYDYDPELGWWSEVDFNGGFVFRVHEATSGWSGEATFAVATERYHEWRAGIAPFLGMPVATFEATEDDDALALVVEWSDTRTGRFEVRDPNGLAMYQETMVGGNDDIYAILPGTTGTWSIVDALVSTDEAEVWVRGLAIETVTF